MVIVAARRSGNRRLDRCLGSCVARAIEGILSVCIFLAFVSRFLLLTGLEIPAVRMDSVSFLKKRQIAERDCSRTQLVSSLAQRATVSKLSHSLNFPATFLCHDRDVKFNYARSIASRGKNNAMRHFPLFMHVR